MILEKDATVGHVFISNECVFALLPVDFGKSLRASFWCVTPIESFKFWLKKAINHSCLNVLDMCFDQTTSNLMQILPMGSLPGGCVR